ncbi:MAG: DUF1553 domain-containing protein [Verrucomicrobiales bacterium]
MKRVIPTAVAVLVSSTSLFATPANRKAFEKYFGPTLPAELKSCAVCHVRSEAHGAETLEEFPHNPFGEKLAALDGKITERFDAVFKSGDLLDKILLGQFPAGNEGDAQQGSPDDSTLSANAAAEPELLERRRAEFAAFRDRYPWRPLETVKRPEVPATKTAGEGNEIDRFIAAEHERLGLRPQPEVEPEVWLRRATVALTGLVPTPEEIREFSKDPDREKKVDQLLDSPRYGERWGRHFMDVWRYADWTGYKDALRESARHIWTWRDWIVESLNEDKGYDRMILEMFAGDELWPTDEKTLRATGYLARNYHRDRNQWMDDVVSHTSQAFLGLTVGCAKCHDHMYDPIPQTDYYSMRAVFEPYRVRTDRVPGELDVMKAGLPRAYDVSTKSKTYLFERGDERFPDKEAPIPPGIPAALGGDYEPTEVDLPELASEPWKRPFVKAELLEKQKTELDGAEAALAKLAEDADAAKREELQQRVAAIEARTAALEAEFAVEDLDENADAWKEKAEATFEAQRQAAHLEAQWKILAAKNSIEKLEGDVAEAKAEKNSSLAASKARALTKAKQSLKDAEKALAAAEKKLEEPLSAEYEPRQEAYPAKSSGRRTAYARWLADKSNPLTARVAANHVWLRHFEHGLVPTVNEFGANGQDPTHPALLDWLAAELMDADWSLKALHRKIVLSAAYRMESTPDSANKAIDPDNHFLWRMPARRMEGEIVRDNLLWVSGRLDDTMGGPDIPHGEAQTSTRRSIYLQHAHEALVEFVQIFDGPKVSECYSREESVQPHQALALHNSPLTKLAADELAAELGESAGDDPRDLVRQAFLRILGREPRDEEASLCQEFLAKPESAEKNRRRLATVLLNHHEFVTIR